MGGWEGGRARERAREHERAGNKRDQERERESPARERERDLRALNHGRRQARQPFGLDRRDAFHVHSRCF